MHLENHDVSYVHVSRGPLDKLEAYCKRLGWKATCASSYGSDFNFDYHVSFSDEQMKSGKLYYNYETIPGAVRLERTAGRQRILQGRAGEVFHTYSSYARGNEEVIGAFIYLDMTPKGRNEKRSWTG